MKHAFLLALTAVFVVGCGSGGGGGSNTPPPQDDPTFVGPPEPPVTDGDGTRPIDPPTTTPSQPPVVGVTPPSTTPAQPPAVVTPPYTTPIQPPEVCVELTWSNPTQRVNGIELAPEEIDYVMVVVTQDPDIFSKGLLNDRIINGDPEVQVHHYLATKLDCEELGIGRLSEEELGKYYLAVAVTDLDGNESALSDIVSYAP